MHETVERDTLDLRYQDYRMRDDDREARLLAAIAGRGIEEPLQGVDTGAGRLLLNGFKRYRCAKKLHLHLVPYTSLAAEEAEGILQFMRTPADKELGILEQARFVTELLTVHGMTPADVALALGRSKGWVSMRRTLLDEISPAIQQLLFAGKFPVYCYMYTLQPFMRMNGVSREEIDGFIRSVAGKRLSVRDIELLAAAYFRGPESMRQAIDEGKLDWSLDYLKRVPDDLEGCNEFERQVLNELQTLQKLMQRISAKCQHKRLQSRAFFAQANLLTGSLLARLEPFSESMQEFHDRSGHA